MKLASLNSTAGKNVEVQREIDECMDLAEESIKDVRTVSYLLYPPMLEELGLKSAISWYLDGFSNRSGIKTTFDISKDFGRLPPDVELAMFRVLQESLTNVHRHSDSPTASVHLSVRDGLAVLEVSDCGKGIPEHLAHAEKDWIGTLGVGMRGMNERMRQLGGRIELSSSPEGTTVSATIPIEGLTNAF